MKWWFQVFFNEFKKVVIYKVLFWFDFLLSTSSHVLISFFLWKAVFESQNVIEMSGYSLRGMVFYNLLSVLIEKINQGEGWKAGASIDIYDGGLTKYLVYPLSYLGFKCATHSTYFFVNWLKSLLGISIFVVAFGWAPEIPFSASGFFMGFILTALSAWLQILLCLSIDCVAFWADNVWSLQVMLRFVSQLLGGALIPLALIPEEYKPFIVRLPFVCLFSNPIQALMGRMSFAECFSAMLTALVWIGIAYLGLRWIWGRGLRVYTGVGV
jgi:ABC-2 type transport system permease protein